MESSFEFDCMDVFCQETKRIIRLTHEEVMELPCAPPLGYHEFQIWLIRNFLNRIYITRKPQP